MDKAKVIELICELEAMSDLTEEAIRDGLGDDSPISRAIYQISETIYFLRQDIVDGNI